MKIFSKAMIVLAFLTVGAWALTKKNSNFQQIAPTDKNAPVEKTADLYLQNCARCHGADGKSETTLGKSLEATDLTSREVQKMSRKKIGKVITHGYDAMPAFDKKLSKAEIKALAEYVRSFK